MPESVSALEKEQVTKMRATSLMVKLLLWVGIMPLLLPESQAFSNLPTMRGRVIGRSSVARGLGPTRGHHWMCQTDRIRNQETNNGLSNHLFAGFQKAGPRARFARQRAERNSDKPNKWFLVAGVMALVGLIWSSSAGVSHAASTMSLGSTYLPARTASLGSWQVLGTATLLMAQAFGGNTLHLACGSLQQAAVWYAACINASPVITKSITAGVIGIWGDSLAQFFEYKLERRRKRIDASPDSTSTCSQELAMHESYSYRRGLSILVDGLFISGPLMHFGYELFESIIPINAGGGAATASSMAALAHVIADSVALDSIFVASTFLVTGIIEGYRMKQLIPQFRTDYFSTLKASWATSACLLPLEFACFRYLPLTFRVLAVNFLDVIWDAVVSFMAHKSRKHDESGDPVVTCDVGGATDTLHEACNAVPAVAY